MDIDKETLEKIIRLAFDMGESWGTTYQGWFIPTEEDKELKIIETIYLCMGELDNDENIQKHIEQWSAS